MRQQHGFTLIEVLVALSIASLSLVALMGRLGASADIQRSLMLQALVMQEARNLWVQDRLKPSVANASADGTLQRQGVTLHWKTWTEKTMLDGFVRRNISVQVAGETKVTLFMYRAL